MHQEAITLRYEAERCRRLINNVYIESTKEMLRQMAQQFEMEAERLERGDGPGAGANPTGAEDTSQL